MTAEQIGKLLQSEFSEGIQEIKLDVIDPWAKVDTAKLIEVLQFLRDNSETAFDFLRVIAAIDYPEEGEIELAYLLFSYKHRHEFKVKTRVKREQPSVPTSEGLWPAANWHERETYDLMGVNFEGHSDLRRILLPDDWVGHPQRKDY